MSVLSKIRIAHLRNISKEEILPAPRLNLFYGENGSGKSSVLEAVYFLALGRSFRNSRKVPLIQLGAEACSVFAELAQGPTLGISKKQRQPLEMRIMGKPVRSVSELARHLPVQLLNSASFRLLDGKPSERRRFMDWGVFHVEPRFHEQWKNFQRCLQNRNSLLKSRAGADQLKVWSGELVKLANSIDAFRRSYIQQFAPVMQEVMDKLISLDGFTMEYRRGWHGEQDLGSVLAQELERDYHYGYTSQGPQKADLAMKLGSQQAALILSRGQQKLLVNALKIAQGAFLRQASGQCCLFLVDDLTAELDWSNQQKVYALLKDLDAQVFICGINRADLERCTGNGEAESEPAQCKVFHVKHGKVLED